MHAMHVNSSHLPPTALLDIPSPPDPEHPPNHATHRSPHPNENPVSLSPLSDQTSATQAPVPWPLQNKQQPRPLIGPARQQCQD
ncbi:hypothetical protein J1614_009584 [Plenodomus biglobosus]|nr:hypothetical protein J1614_009584 [Plenodomus biglobosus]